MRATERAEQDKARIDRSRLTRRDELRSRVFLCQNGLGTALHRANSRRQLQHRLRRPRRGRCDCARPVTTILARASLDSRLTRRARLRAARLRLARHVNVAIAVGSTGRIWHGLGITPRSSRRSARSESSIHSTSLLRRARTTADTLRGSLASSLFCRSLARSFAHRTRAVHVTKGNLVLQDHASDAGHASTRAPDEWRSQRTRGGKRAWNATIPRVSAHEVDQWGQTVHCVHEALDNGSPHARESLESESAKSRRHFPVTARIHQSASDAARCQVLPVRCNAGPRLHAPVSPVGHLSPVLRVPRRLSQMYSVQVLLPGALWAIGAIAV